MDPVIDRESGFDKVRGGPRVILTRPVASV
jgi:hypothetical protein